VAICARASGPQLPLAVHSAAPENLGISRFSFCIRSPAAESLPEPTRGYGAQRVGGYAASHVRCVPSWSAWSPAVSGSNEARHVDTGSGVACCAPAFQPAMEPFLQDLLHLAMRGEPVDLGIVDPREQVHGGHVVCIALPVAIPVGIAAMKPVPATVVLGDIPAAGVRTGLAGVGCVGRFDRNASASPRLQPWVERADAEAAL
jgi:hypothetical protein